MSDKELVKILYMCITISILCSNQPTETTSLASRHTVIAVTSGVTCGLDTAAVLWQFERLQSSACAPCQILCLDSMQAYFHLVLWSILQILDQFLRFPLLFGIKFNLICVCNFWYTISTLFWGLEKFAEILLMFNCFGCYYSPVCPYAVLLHNIYIYLTYFIVIYLLCSSDQQGLDSTHSQYTQLSSSPLEPDLGYNCRTPLNHLLCQCSSPEIHYGEQSGDHSQLKRVWIGRCLLDTQYM